MTATGDGARWLTSREVAEVLRVHPKSVYRLVKRGLPAHRIGGEWRFDRAAVLRWSGASTAVVTERDAVAPREPATPPLLAANGDVAVRALLDVLNGSAGALWGFVQADRTGALRWLAEGRVTAAGSHGAMPPPRAGEARLARVHLVEREVGLVARAGAGAPSLAAMHRAKVAARPESAGVQMHLVAALRAAKLSPERALSKARAWRSHAEVVGAVLRGEADVGITTRAMAHAHGLVFTALARESYGLLVRSASLGTPAVVALCEAAQSPTLRAVLSAVPGYDASRCGDIRYDPDEPAEATR